jgi:DNA replication protein DnaC
LWNIEHLSLTAGDRSWLACALGTLAARNGFTAAYLRAPRLMETLHEARGDGSHLKMLHKLAKIQVLVLDDFLMSPLSDEARQDTLEIIEDRYAAGATVITSQYHTDDWYERRDTPADGATPGGDVDRRVARLERLDADKRNDFLDLGE